MINRPVLRYHGGKWMLAPWIISHFPRHRVYTEVFGGAASVLLRKRRSFAEVYNDLAGDVVNLFRVLRDPVSAAALEQGLRLTPFAREEFKGAYEPAADPVERARRLVTRSFMGFGSASHNPAHSTGFRSNSNRSGTTAAHDWVSYPRAIAEFTDRLRGVVIENRPAAEVIRQHDGPTTLHYADPPYPHSTRKAKNPYCQKGYIHEMSDDDHRRLAEVLRSVRGMVVLSGYPCDLYDLELFPDWPRVDRPAMADGARPRIERLWLSPSAAHSTSRPTLFDSLPA